jgi:hypothetical protein
MSGLITERRLAEVAMDGRWSADLPELGARRWPPVASRIQEARLRTGLSDTEVARRLGLTVTRVANKATCRRGFVQFFVTASVGSQPLAHVAP